MLQNVIEHFFMDKKCGCLAEYLDGESDQTQKDVAFACAKLIAKKGMKNIRQITLAPLNRSELDIRGMNVFCDVNGLENVKVVTSNLKLRF